MNKNDKNMLKYGDCLFLPYPFIPSLEVRCHCRREIYLTIQSSLDFQEAAHKILKMGIKPQLEVR